MTYNDPVHVPSVELVVVHKGKEVSLLNKALLDQQNCWENVNLLKEFSGERLDLYDEMRTTKDIDLLAFYDALCTTIEYDLQDLWKFPRDMKFHLFWVRPKCKCPKSDNRERYATGYVVVNQGCPLHGK